MSSASRLLTLTKSDEEIRGQIPLNYWHDVRRYRRTENIDKISHGEVFSLLR